VASIPRWQIVDSPMRLIATLLVVALHAPAAAQEPTRGTFVGPVRAGSEGEARRLNQQLFAIAEAEALYIREDEQWGDLVRRTCGYADEDQARRLEALNGHDEPGRRAARLVKAPPCVRFEHRPTFQIDSGESVAAIALRATGFDGPDTMALIERLNPSLVNLTEVPIKTQVTLRYANPDVAIRLSSHADPALVDDFLRGAGRDLDIPPTLSLVSAPATLTSAADRAACHARAGWPFDVKPVVELLVRYRNDFPTAGVHRPVAIAVIDTGMPRGAENVLPLWLPEHEQGLPRDRQKPYAPYPDDELGINIPAGGGFPLAPANYTEGHHGLHVAAIASGAAFPELSEAVRPLVRVKMLAVTRLESRGTGTVWSAHRDTLAAAIYYARLGMSPSSQVLNWSWESQRKDPALSAHLRPKTELIVAAAGNRSVDIDDNNLAVWPAAFSRDSNTTVISVAALRAPGELASFSNYGMQTVSIAAPGCAIPTLDSDGKETTAHGTSFAAPLVTLAAATLSALGITSVEQLRDRILIAADREPALIKRVQLGRVFNLRDTLAIHDDVIRLRNQPTCLGKLAKPIPLLNEDQRQVDSDYQRLDVLSVIDDRVTVQLEYTSSGGSVTLKTAYATDFEFDSLGVRCPSAVRLADVSTIVRAISN